MNYTLEVRTHGKGLYEVTEEVRHLVDKSKSEDGLCVVFITHTSASLLIQENADPSAKRDLEKWLERLVPEGDKLFTHTSEGADDMPSHIKAALTATSIAIPISKGELTLGTWQGIYIWEHRRDPHRRSLVISILP
jgi:secondary thiamine-phosphate synthase enzyme